MFFIFTSFIQFALIWILSDVILIFMIIVTYINNRFCSLYSIFAGGIPCIIREMQKPSGCTDPVRRRDAGSGCGRCAFASDMMSDVLAFAAMLTVSFITGLCNPQVVRTAEMLDIVCIIFVRGKIPGSAISWLWQGQRICAILHTEQGMFTTCGILYSSGL